MAELRHRAGHKEARSGSPWRGLRQALGFVRDDTVMKSKGTVSIAIETRVLFGSLALAREHQPGPPMISADMALEIVLENVGSLGIERAPILDALGRVLAEEIRSPRDIPGFDNSAMDGYAVRAADVASASEARPVRLRVIETIAAGAMPTRAVASGQAARIMTGAPMPEGADAIVMVERTRSAGDTVEIMTAAEPRNYVRPRGEDLRAGEAAIPAGKRLTPSDIGMLASLNRAMVDVNRRPRVAL